MTTPRMFRAHARWASVLLLSVSLSACGGSGGGGGGGAGAAPTSMRRVSLPGNASVTDADVPAGVPTFFEFSSTGPSDGPFTSVAVNVVDTFDMIEIDPPGTPLLGVVTGTADVTIRVGQLDQPDTCTAGFLVGTFTMPLDGSDPSVSSIDANESCVNLINTGQYTICVEVVSTASARLTVPMLELDVEECTAAPADLSGEWNGTYSCTHSCGPGFGGDVSIFIQQDGTNARYTDGDGGVFSGTVCGTQFHFAGGYFCDINLMCDEIETGVFTLQQNGSGRKQSTYTYLDGSMECTGDCNDTMTRVDPSRYVGAYDVDLADSEWVIQAATGTTGLSAEQQQSSYRRTTFSAGGAATNQVYHRSTERSYTPLVTLQAIDAVEFQFTTQLQSAPAKGSVEQRPAIFQLQSDGTIEVFEAASGSSTLAGPDWIEANYGMLTASDFWDPTGTVNPSFVGETMWFGYLLDIEHAAGGDIVHACDDFSVTIYVSP